MGLLILLHDFPPSDPPSMIIAFRGLTDGSVKKSATKPLSVTSFLIIVSPANLKNHEQLFMCAG